MLKVDNTNVLLCSCGDTMDINGKAIAKGCGAEAGDIATSLCRMQTDRIMAALAVPEDGTAQQTAIACTQETAVFEALAEEAGTEAPAVFNIREKAGWSDEGSKAGPKIAALVAEAVQAWPGTPAMEMVSHGRCLIYGRGEEALAMGAALIDDLGVTVMLTHPEETMVSAQMAGVVATGKISAVSGSFTKFDVVIDRFAEARPQSRDGWSFDPLADGVETECDILIDLTGDTPLVSGAHKRDGYFRADPDDSRAHDEIISRARGMIGTFEKPIYVRFDEHICAHSRNSISGCNRCLDVCPAGAIQPAGDSVAIDQGICGGCGLCGAVCPSGAAQTIYPEAEAVAARMALLVETYRDAGGKTPALLIHDDVHGGEMIGLMARYSKGLPAHVIPLAMHSAARTGHDTLVAAFALGFDQVFVLLDPEKADENAPVHDQITLARDLLAGIGNKAEDRIIVLDDRDPDVIADALYQGKPPKALKAAPFVPSGTPRGMTRLALRGLAKANSGEGSVIPLAAGAPYGRVEIDTDNCTICLSCVGACPAGALQDNPDAPQLLFREDACLQCGICASTCPEKVITLAPQFNLGDDAMTNQLVIEDEPFACTECGKPFGTKRSIENIIGKLENHSMFADEGRLAMLKQCEDCRVKSLFDGQSKMMDIGERPKPRTTDDYMN